MGGIMWTALNYYAKTHHIRLTDDYPYEAADLECREAEKVDRPYHTEGYAFTGLGDCNGLLRALVDQPVAVALQAGNEAWKYYAGGIVTSETCASTPLDHGVLAVGYYKTELNGEDTYVAIVKNSWGRRWGNAGYIDVTILDDACGICTQPTIAVL